MMKKISDYLSVILLLITSVSCAEADSTPPTVVETFPVTGSVDVDPSINEIFVTFSEPMQDGNWSWAMSDGEAFPKIKGKPYYLPGQTKNVLPVELETDKEYEIWINSNNHKNFKDQAGNSAIPFRLIFGAR